MGRRTTTTGLAVAALLLTTTGGAVQAAVPVTETETVSSAAVGTATMTGRLTLPAGESATSVIVHVRPQTVGGVRPQGPNPVRPSADGRWRVDGLEAGTYRVEFVTRPEINVPGQWYGGGRWSGEAKDVVVPGSGTVSGVDETLVLGATVTGVVRAASGEPVEGVWVLPYEENHFYGVQAFTLGTGGYTDAHGRYSIRRLRGVVHRFEVADLHGRGYERGFLGGGSTLAQARDFTVVASRVHSGLDHQFVSGPGSEKPRPAKEIVVRAKPKVSGKAKVGRTLKATRGTYAPTSVKVSFQWQTKKGAKAVTIKGATASKLKLTKKFKGKRVRVRVTVKAAGRPTVVRTTGWSKKVA